MEANQLDLFANVGNMVPSLVRVPTMPNGEPIDTRFLFPRREPLQDASQVHHIAWHYGLRSIPAFPGTKRKWVFIGAGPYGQEIQLTEVMTIMEAQQKLNHRDTVLALADQLEELGVDYAVFPNVRPLLYWGMLRDSGDNEKLAEWKAFRNQPPIERELWGDDVCKH